MQASKVHSQALPHARNLGSEQDAEDPELSAEEFKRLQLEVERLGEKALVATKLLKLQ